MEDNLIEITELKYRDVEIRLPPTQEAIDNARKLLDLLENDLAGGKEDSKVQQGTSQQGESPKKKRKWSDEEKDIITNNLDQKPAQLKHLLWLYGYERSYGAVDQQQRKLLELQRQEEGDEEPEETPEPEQQLSGDWKQLTAATAYMFGEDTLVVRNQKSGIKVIELNLGTLYNLVEDLENEETSATFQMKLKNHGIQMANASYLLKLIGKEFEGFDIKTGGPGNKKILYRVDVGKDKEESEEEEGAMVGGFGEDEPEPEEEPSEREEQELEGWVNLISDVYYKVDSDGLYLVRDTREGVKNIGEWDLELLDIVFNDLPDEATEDDVKKACARNGLEFFLDLAYLMRFYHAYVRYDAELTRDGEGFHLIKEQYSLNRERRDKLEQERDLIDSGGD